MGCSEGCKKVKTEEHNRLLGLQRERILQEQEAITNAEIENERIRLEKEVDSKFKSEISRYRKEYEENATNGAEILATNKLKSKITQEQKIEEEVQKRFDKRVEEIRKVGCVAWPILFNESEEVTKS